MIKPKLDLKSLTDQQVIDLLNLVATRMAASATLFPSPAPVLGDLTEQATAVSNLLAQRASLLAQAQALTVQIREARNVAEAQLNTEASYVDEVANGNPAIIKDAGMDTSNDTHTTVGTLPKVTGLVATQGDTDGEIDAHWDPIKRGLLNYTVEITEDPAGQSGWHYAKNESKSKTALTGLVSGKRYWLRVSANGSAGPSPASDPATKTAP